MNENTPLFSEHLTTELKCPWCNTHWDLLLNNNRTAPDSRQIATLEISILAIIPRSLFHDNAHDGLCSNFQSYYIYKKIIGS